MINLGDTVKDKITGFKGVAISRHEYLNGCIRFCVQPPVDKNGKVPEEESFDEEQLQVVKKKAPKRKRTTTVGGPNRTMPSNRRTGKQMDQFNILSPGPGLLGVSLRTLRGKTVAVNRAVYFLDGMTDYLCIIDVPFLWEVLEFLKHSPYTPSSYPIIWTCDEHRKHLLKEYGDLFTVEYFTKRKRPYNEGLPFGHQLLWIYKSCFVAIGNALKAGSKNVNLYGFNLKGSQYTDGSDINRYRDDRWYSERRTIAEIMCLGRQQGYRIRRVLP